MESSGSQGVPPGLHGSVTRESPGRLKKLGGGSCFGGPYMRDPFLGGPHEPGQGDSSGVMWDPYTGAARLYVRSFDYGSHEVTMNTLISQFGFVGTLFSKDDIHRL